MTSVRNEFSVIAKPVERAGQKSHDPFLDITVRGRLRVRSSGSAKAIGAGRLMPWVIVHVRRDGIKQPVCWAISIRMPLPRRLLTTTALRGLIHAATRMSQPPPTFPVSYGQAGASICAGQANSPPRGGWLGAAPKGRRRTTSPASATLFRLRTWSPVPPLTHFLRRPCLAALQTARR